MYWYYTYDPLKGDIFINKIWIYAECPNLTSIKYNLCGIPFSIKLLKSYLQAFILLSSLSRNSYVYKDPKIRSSNLK